MPRIVIDTKHCKGCRLCVTFCPKKILKMSPIISTRGITPVEVTDETMCSGCLNCVVICPDTAIEIIAGDGSEKPEA